MNAIDQYLETMLEKNASDVHLSTNHQPCYRIDGEMNFMRGTERLTEEELTYFLSLEENFRREAFIDAFWAARDLDPETPYNEFKRRWLDRAYQALSDWGTLEDARSRFFLTNGEPGRFVLGNGRVISHCYEPREELEIWFYGGSDRTKQRFVVIFFKPRFRSEWFYRLWLVDQELEVISGH